MCVSIGAADAMLQKRIFGERLDEMNDVTLILHDTHPECMESGQGGGEILQRITGSSFFSLFLPVNII